MQGVGIDCRAWPKKQAFEVKICIESAYRRRSSQATSVVNIAEIVGFQFRESMIDPAMPHCSRHPTEMVVVLHWQPSKAWVSAMCMRNWISCNVCVCSSHQLHMGSINMADGICSRPHCGGSVSISNRTFPDSPRPSSCATSNAFSPISGSGGGGSSHVELLLVPQE